MRDWPESRPGGPTLPASARPGQLAERVYQPASQPRRPPTRTRYQVRPAWSFAVRTTPTFVPPASVAITLAAVEGVDRRRRAVVVARRLVTTAALAAAVTAVVGGGVTVAGRVAIPVWRNAVKGVVRNAVDPHAADERCRSPSRCPGRSRRGTRPPANDQVAGLPPLRLVRPSARNRA